MKFTELPIAGAYVIDLERQADDRGFFARAWCRHEFAAHGLADELVQASLAFTYRRGTLRGVHYQAAPHEETKVVRCVRGAAFVVALDLRVDSHSYLCWHGVELSADNRRAIYVPPGCAQGYQTLADDTELLYQMSHAYVKQAARGVRYDDPAFGIPWPLEVSVISDADRRWPDYAVSRPRQFAASAVCATEGAS